MKKIFVIALIVLVITTLFCVSVMADPGDEHQNGPEGTQPHNGQLNGEDDSQPQTCKNSNDPDCYRS